MLRLAALLTLIASTGLAQNFTTSAEVKPILAATKGNWIAVREFDGQDLVYFTQILSWRCGVTEIQYSINGAAPQVYAQAPCHSDTASPNAILATDPLPYEVFPLGSVETVAVTLFYDDGSTDTGTYERAAVLMP